MKNIYFKILKDKKFILLLMLFILLLIFIVNPILNIKTEYMDVKNIRDYLYVYYVFMLPMSFFDMGLLVCFMLDLIYLSIVFYLVVSIINCFFVNCSTSMLVRVNRDIWIKKIILYNNLYTLIISFIYILFFFVLCLVNDFVVVIDYKLVLPMIYKVILSLIVNNILLLMFILSKSFLISISFSIFIFILLELIVKTTFSDSNLLFNYPLLMIIFLLVLLICIYKLIILNFKRSDI